MKRTIVSVLVIIIMVLGGFGYLVNISSGWNSSQEHQGLSTKDTNVVKVISDRYETRAISSTVSNTVYISGTYIINQTTVDPLTGQKGKYGFDANVVVTSTGKLIVENATLYFLSDVNHRYSLTVNGGLYFYNVTFTIAHGLVEPYFPFKFTISGPSYSKVEIINSRLLFPGWFNVTNKNGNVVIYNTTFAKMSSSPTDYPAPPSYGPTPYFYNSKVYIGNTQFRNLFKNQTGGSGNIGWINDTTGYTISSSSGAVIDNFQESKLYSWYWSYVVLKNVAVRVDYSNATGYDSSSNFIIEYENKQLLNMTIQALSNGASGILNANILLMEYGWTPNQFYEKLSSGDIRVYVTNSKNKTVTISKVSFGIEIEKNLLKYGIKKFSFNVIGSTLYLRDVYVDVDYSPRADLGVSHNMFYFTGASRMYALNLTINDTGKSPRYDTAFLMNDSNSEAYILRYSLTKVYFRNISLDGLNVSATPYPVDFSDNSQLISEMMGVMRTYVENTALIPLMKLGDVRISGNVIYDKTVNGRVYLPLLSDIINQTEEPNSKFVGVYQLSIKNSTKEFYHAQIGLGYYPWLLVSNNTCIENITLDKYKDVDIGVKSVDVVSASPYVPGRSESIRVSVENYGKDEADGVEVYVYINGNLYKVYDVGTIGGQESKEYEWEINGSEFPTNGSYNISVDVVQEWDYNLSNNRGSVVINVGSIWVSAWQIGEAIRYHDVWINYTISSVYYWSGVKIYVYLDNESNLLNESEVNIRSGNTFMSFEWYISGAVAPGTHYIRVYMDNGVEIGVYRIEIKRDVDIGVKSVDVVSASPYVPGRSESIRVSVENYGKDEADGVEVYVYINGNLYKVYDVGTIGGQESKEYEWEINGSEFPTNGGYNISIDVVQEWDYNLSNNRGSVLINVGSIWVSAWSVGTPVRYSSIWVNVTLNSEYSWNNVGIYLYLDNRTVVVNSTVTNINKGLTEISFGWYISDNVSAGPHTLLLYLSNGVFLGSFSINVKRDIDLAVSSLSITPNQVYIGETLSIQASIVNLGKEAPSSAMVYINIYDPLGTLVQNKTFAYPSTYALSFVPNMVGDYRVEVKVVAPGDYVSSNNVMSKVFTVYAEPFTLSISAGNEYVNGTNIVVNVTVTSNVDANASLVLYIPDWNMALNPITPKNPVNLKANTPVTVAFLIQKTFYQRYLKGKASINVVYQINITSDITGNAKYVHPGKEFVIKEKTNFVLSSLLITQGERQVSTVAEGVKIGIHFIVRNYGGLPGALDYVILDNGKPLIWGKAGILAPGNYKVIFYNYTVTSLGTHNIEVKVNPNGTVQESIYGDDVAVKKLNVIMPSLKIIVTSYSLEHNTKVYVGDTLVVVVKIINMNATESQGKTIYMKGVKVQLILTGGLGTYTQTTNAYGLAIFHIKATAPGTYNPQLQLTYQGYVEKYTPSGMAINVEKKPFTLPWLWIIIIVIVAAIAGFFLYGYISFKREAPEYMVCGNCGHLIPADSEKCPYCGVVFEKEKVKCPECGSWIDEDAKFCPVCGTIFMPPEDPEFKKYEKLKENYEKYIDKYKEEAKKYIGEKFTTEEFFKWWKTHPEFISFLEWVKRQEEKIEGATVRCPICGSLNPKGAKICRVCGSPLPVFEEKEHEEKREEGKKETPVIPKEELERLKRPGVVTVEEWAKRKQVEKREKEEEKKAGDTETGKKEEKELEKKEKKEEKPVVRKKIIKKVIAVKKEKE
ncbi:CARDB domain-containing protein [Aciduliprofundum sp. MAR08-339]|uniref:CARDB domain-containing protein n=1 Tax=Aciduliprofundum sp. (strain MAR08-339) TaxID=673860 RepID=UPI0002A4A6BD|nr:CARDB domain-containing protein [Aciduliprofundum sp. MAR08-339]